jgi:hypothetical protein
VGGLKVETPAKTFKFFWSNRGIISKIKRQNNWYFHDYFGLFDGDFKPTGQQVDLSRLQQSLVSLQIINNYWNNLSWVNVLQLFKHITAFCLLGIIIFTS